MFRTADLLLTPPSHLKFFDQTSVPSLCDPHTPTRIQQTFRSALIPLPKVLFSPSARRSVPPPGDLSRTLPIHPLSTPKVLFSSSNTDSRSSWATCAWHPECSNSPLCVVLRPSTFHRRSLGTPWLTCWIPPELRALASRVASALSISSSGRCRTQN